MLNFIDLHVHMSLTDHHGVCGREEISKFMRDAVCSGVSDIVVTPHVDAYQSIDSSDLEQTIASVHSEFSTPILHPGCEFLIRRPADVLSTSRNAVVVGNRYLQAEFLPDCRVSTACESLYELRLQGYNPIVVHPERITALGKSPIRAIELKREGALLQGTLAALVGTHGTRVQNALVELLRLGHIDFLASDFHGGDYAGLISDSRVILGKLLGAEHTQRLLYDVPKYFLYG